MAPTNGDRKEVVIVEDETELASLYEVWLQDDYATRIAHDAETAYELFDESMDVVLLDRMLPDGTGDELLEHVRDAEYDCGVAMVSAVEPGFDIVHMGIDDYVPKPTSREELQAAVDRLLAQSEYREGVGRLYSLVKKKSLIEAHHSAAQLEASDEYDELLAEIERFDEELVSKCLEMSEYQLHSELASI